MVLGVDGGRAAREVMSCCDSLRAGREPVQDSALCTLWVYCASQYIVCVVRCSADSTMMTKERNNMRARVQSLLMTRV